MTMLSAPETPTRPLTFVRRGARVTLPNVPPSRTLLDLLREDLHLSATKEGCGEGDCGACTVVLADTEGDGLRYRAVNSCIQLAHSVHGMALWTAADLASDPLIDRQGAALHPVQQALLDAHGSQCGFCTPGFAMSLFGMYQNHCAQGGAIDRATAQAELSGNLCRCTGYRPILDAAQAMGELPAARVDEATLVGLLRQIDPADPAPDADPAYRAPATLATLLQARARHPDAQVVAGCTDVGLWVTKGHRQYRQVLDVTRAAELRRIEHHPQHLAIGAAATLTDAFAALVQDRPQLAAFAERFAGLPVRNAGTLGGNVANGSPIGDGMPLLIALGARVVLARWTDGQVAERELALEDFYTGYRQNVLRPDELLTRILVPRPAAPCPAGEPGGLGEWTRVYKVSKRFDDDISAVCLAVSLQLEQGTVVRASIGAGGVAATPARATAAEAALTGQPWNADSVRHAMAVLRDAFQPISDMRASAAYRREVLGNLLWRCWLDSRTPPDGPVIGLERLHPALLRTPATQEGAR
ncbi:xanthine dehydrogenase small subunit [Macromonas nakdongensis]|uniref:xanthine dehydrogenase small subunit n=1 Tax=Macromonas nakdongensis TaxID=1843082 RepID=UPI001E4A5533|nr:xanthine dehydrogenase small subunit [Macromonas nakdongensis]